MVKMLNNCSRRGHKRYYYQVVQFTDICDDVMAMFDNHTDVFFNLRDANKVFNKFKTRTSMDGTCLTTRLVKIFTDEFGLDDITKPDEIIKEYKISLVGAL